MAYFCVHSRAVRSYSSLFVLYMCAISGTRGSSGLGSVSMEQMESRTIPLLVAEFYSCPCSDMRQIRAGRLTFGDGQGRGPLVSQDVQADAAIAVDIGVVDAGGKVHLGRLERVVGGEVDGEEEDTAGIWRVLL